MRARPGFDSQVLINPSLFIHEGEVKIAVRRHHLESWEHIGEHNGSVVHVIEQSLCLVGDPSRVVLGADGVDLPGLRE